MTVRSPLALVVWCATIGLVVLILSGVTMAALLAGCVINLLVNVARVVRRRRTSSRLGHEQRPEAC